MLLQLVVNGQEVAVEVSRRNDDYQILIDGRSCQVQARDQGDGSWLLDTDAGRRLLHVGRRADERLVFADGVVTACRIHDPDHDADDEAEGAGPCLVAEMPGKVVQVLVEVGQEVVEGQTLVIMESMKMETEMAASVSGIVSEIHVAADDLVGKDDPLVDITVEE